MAGELAGSIRPEAFLELPGEVRLIVYEHLFRDTKVYIHNTAVRDRFCLRNRSAKNMHLLATSNIINQEATPIFLRNANFRIKCDHCWTKYSGLDFRWPAINNLTIEDPSFPPRHSNPFSRSDAMAMTRVISSVITRRFDTGLGMNSLAWKLPICDDHTLKYEHRTLLKYAPQFIRHLRLTAYDWWPASAVYNLIFATDKSSVEEEAPKRFCEVSLRLLRDFLEGKNVHLGRVMRVLDGPPTPKEERLDCDFVQIGCGNCPSELEDE